MGRSGIVVRSDFDAKGLRKLASGCKDAGQTRRLLSLAAVYDGASREEAAKVGGMDRQTLRDWVHRFNEAGPDGLVNRKSPGRPGSCPGSDMILHPVATYLPRWGSMSPAPVASRPRGSDVETAEAAR